MEMCTNIGERVMDVLCNKHPYACPSPAASLDTYPECPPELVPMDINDDTVTEVAGKIYGGAGKGGTDLLRLHN